MPSRSDLLNDIRKADPRAANVPDDELAAALAKKYPKYADVLAGPTPEKISVSDAAKQRLESMKRGPAKKQYEQAQESASRDIKQHIATAVGETAAMAPFAIAAPFTAGASLPVGAAIMGGAGAAGGLIREGIEYLGGKRQSLKDLAFTLGVDTAFGAGGEVVGRGLVLAKTQIPKLLQRAAVKSEVGKALVEETYADVRSELDSIVGKRLVSIEKPITSTYQQLEKLPKGRGGLGEQLTGLTAHAEETASNIAASQKAEIRAARLKNAIDKAQLRQAHLENVRDVANIAKTGRELIAQMEATLGDVEGRIASKQPLDALIEMKGNASQMAWGETTNIRERPVFRRMAEGFDKIIRNELRGDPEALQLYERANEIGRTLFSQRVGLTMAEKFIHSYAGRMVGYGSFGAAGGAYFGRSPEAAATGAAMAAGASIGVPKLATFILQQTMRHPEAAAKLGRAIEFSMRGDSRTAKEMAGRAFAMAGVRETIKEALKSQSSEDQ